STTRCERGGAADRPRAPTTTLWTPASASLPRIATVSGRSPGLTMPAGTARRCRRRPSPCGRAISTSVSLTTTANHDPEGHGGGTGMWSGYLLLQLLVPGYRADAAPDPRGWSGGELLRGEYSDPLIYLFQGLVGREDVLCADHLAGGE